MEVPQEATPTEESSYMVLENMPQFVKVEASKEFLETNSMMVDLGEDVEVTPPLENPLTLAEVEAAMGFIPVLVVMMEMKTEKQDTGTIASNTSLDEQIIDLPC